MKKRILAIGLLSGSLLLANGYKDNNDYNKGYGNMEGRRGSFISEELTEEQRIKFEEYRNKMHEELTPLKLDLEEINIKIERLLLEDPVDWVEVEKLIGNKSDKKAEIEIKSLKTKKEMQEEFGFFGKMGRFFGNGRGNCHR